MKLVEFVSPTGVVEYINPDSINYGHDHGDHYSVHLNDGAEIQIAKTDQNAIDLFNGVTF